MNGGRKENGVSDKVYEYRVYFANPGKLPALRNGDPSSLHAVQHEARRLLGADGRIER
jgi:hypothetical protein